MNAMAEDGTTGWRVLLVVFLLLVFAITGTHAQMPDFCDGTGIVSNENQLAAAYDCDVFGLLFGPPDFRVWLTWPRWFWCEPASLPSEFGTALAQSQDEIQGVTVLKVRLTRAILDGTTLVEFGTNSLTLAAPAGYSATNAADSATRSALVATRQWIEWGELSEDAQPTLRLDIALANVRDKPAFEAAEALAWEEDEAKAAEAGMFPAMSEAGSEYAMSGGGNCVGCPVIETNAFSVCTIAYDASNSTASVTFESCDTHFYSIFSTDKLSTNTVWTFRTNLVGQADSTTWVDYDDLSVLTARFYRVARLASDADADLDGLSNAFELQYGLDPLNPADAAGDLDGDGYSNWDEMLMGTSPVATDDLVTVYVDSQNSTGPWDGTQAHPFRYIQDAMQCAVNVNSNLAIRVRPGNYYEPVSNVQYDFYGNLLRLRARVYLYAANNDWSLSSTPETHLIDASNLPHNDVLGNSGFGSAPAVEFLAVFRARIDGFTIRGGQGYSILADGYYGAGILAYSPSGPIYISNCIVEKNGSGGASEAGGIYIEAATNSLIYNTVVAYNRGFEAGGIDDYGGVRIWNCTVIYNQSGAVGGIYGYDSNSTRVRNCVIWGHELDVALANVDYSTFGSNLVVTSGGHNVSLDPQLVNAIAGNYRLQTNSLMLSAGTLLPIERRDLYGNHRPATGGFDIGANQYQDTDGDGMQDDWETKHGLNPNNGGDATGDPDSDNLNNLIEYNGNTDPQNQDTDGDGIRDDLDSDPATPELVLTFEWHDAQHQSVWKYWINGTNDPAWLNQPPTQPRVMKFNNYHIGDRLALQQSYHSGATNTIYFLVPLQSTGAFSVLPDADATPVWQFTQAAPIGDRTPPDPGWLTTVWQATPTNAEVCAGFDDQTPKYFNFVHRTLSVPQNGTNSVSIQVFPLNVHSQVVFQALNSLISVTPGQATGPTQLVQVAGLTTGTNIQSSTFVVWGVGAQQSYTNAAAIIDADVLPKATNVTIALYRITATSSNFPPSNVPTAAELKSYLDNVFGKQANVYMSVLNVTNLTVNYDVAEPNGKLDWYMSGGLSYEQIAITSAVYRAGAINVYYVNDLTSPDLDAKGIAYAFTNGPVIFIQDSHANTSVNISAHEIGHALGLGHPNDPGQRLTGDPDRLMWRYDEGDNPCRLIRSEWRTVNTRAK